MDLMIRIKLKTKIFCIIKPFKIFFKLRDKSNKIMQKI